MHWGARTRDWLRLRGARASMMGERRSSICIGTNSFTRLSTGATSAHAIRHHVEERRTSGPVISEKASSKPDVRAARRIARKGEFRFLQPFTSFSSTPSIDASAART